MKVLNIMSRDRKSRIVRCSIIFIVANIAILTTAYLRLRTPQAALVNKREAEEYTAKVTERSTNNSITRTILLWNIPDAVSYPKVLSRDRCGNCVITTDKSRLKVSDAVVINFHKATSLDHLPKRQPDNPDQVFVWLCRESPKTTKNQYKLDLSNLDNIINWTMTYRLDSDVFFPYAEILHRLHDEKRLTSTSTIKEQYVDLYYKDIDDLLSRKRHLVAWVVGNCDGTYGAQARMELVDKLIKAGLPVHRYGKCFKDRQFPPYRSEEAHEKLIEYKFYLAFENTFGCRDYVTYKFWKNSIYSGAVPVVWGPKKSDLLRMAPEKSFIHVGDFESINHLIYFLKYLDSNETAYREYFLWRENELPGQPIQRHDGADWIFSTGQVLGYCQLCRMLHVKDTNHSKFLRKTIASLHDWWYKSENGHCIE